MFEQVSINVQRAKDVYRQSLKSIDGELRKIVSRDPAQLAAARAIQASYSEGIEGCDLEAAEQPEASPVQKSKPAPKSPKKK